MTLYTPAFKSHVINFALGSGLPKSEVAKNFGISVQSLNNWLKEYKQDPQIFDTDEHIARQGFQGFFDSNNCDGRNDIFESDKPFFSINVEPFSFTTAPFTPESVQQLPQGLLNNAQEGSKSSFSVADMNVSEINQELIQELAKVSLEKSYLEDVIEIFLACAAYLPITDELSSEAIDDFISLYNDKFDEMFLCEHIMLYLQGCEAKINEHNEKRDALIKAQKNNARNASGKKSHSGGKKVSTSARTKAAQSKNTAPIKKRDDFVVLADDIMPTAPLEIFVTDFTKIHVPKVTAYVFFVLDIFSRKILTAKAFKRLPHQYPQEILAQALADNSIPEKELRDYTAPGSGSIQLAFTAKMIKNNIMPDLGDKCNRKLGSYATSFLSSFHTEFAYREDLDPFTSFEDFQTKMDDYITWWNKSRVHSSLDYFTPIEFEKKFYQEQPPKLHIVKD